MPKVIIFTASTGGGHNQVANVLDKEFRLCGYVTKTIDFLKESGKLLDLVFTSGYNQLAMRSANIFGLIYRISNNEKVDRQLKTLLTKLLVDRINDLVQINKPDLIVCTHPLIVNILGSLKTRRKINIPIISVVTDFDAHHMYFNQFIDAYITPSNHTRDMLVNGGIPKNRVYSYGIPIKREFWMSSRQADYHEKFTILLMGGSIGHNYVNKALNMLMDNPNPLKILVVCGNNNYLKKRIESKFSILLPDKELISYGFTREISRLMDQSDVIITKPGGVTTSEAIVKNVPLIIPYALPGQETENTRILVDHGLAVKADSMKELNEFVNTFISNPKFLNKLSQNMARISKTNSLDSIIRLAENLISRYREEWINIG